MLPYRVGRFKNSIKDDLLKMTESIPAGMKHAVQLRLVIGKCISYSYILHRRAVF